MAELRVGSYRLTAPIGRGGTAEVWRAVHVERGTSVAVKLVKGEQDAAARSAFAAEVRAIAALEHPHIVRVHDQGEVSRAAAAASEGVLAAGQPWLVMELATSGTLAQMRDQMDWRTLRQITIALLDALAHAHARGVLHRDLKPGNVLVGGERPGPKLADFGLAWALAGSHPDAASFLASGTPSYMAPEQIAGAWRDFGPWTDLYALGATLWRMVTGAAPFVGSRDQVLTGHLSRPLPAFGQAFPVPTALEPLLRKMLEKAPQQRFGSAAEAREAFAELPREGYGEIRPSESSDDDRTILRPSARVEASFATLPPRSPVPIPSRWEERRDSRSTVLPGLGLFGLRALPIVGREEVAQRLWDRLAQVDADGRARVVALLGDAGLGAGRIAARLAERAHEAAGLVHVRVTHAPIAGPGDGLVAALAAAWRVDGLPPDKAEARIRALIPTRDRHAEDGIVRALTRADGLDHPNDRNAALARALRLLGGGRAVVLVLEDVHWGADTLAWLAWLADSALHGEPEPVLAVAAAQIDATAPGSAAETLALRLVDRKNVDRVALKPIEPSSWRALVDAVLPLDREVAAGIATRSGGDPASVAQVVADLVESDALIAGPDTYKLRPGVSWVADPTASTLRRVDRAVRPGELGAVELAALLGPRVDAEEWRAACALLGAQASDALVERLLWHGLARGSASAWAFRDGAVPGRILARAQPRLAALHLACAGALASLGRDPARVGRHRLAGGDLDGALDPLLTAAEAAFERREFRGIRELSDEASAAVVQLGLPESDERLARARTMAAEIFTSDSDFREKVALAERAGAQAREQGWPEIVVRALQVAARKLRSYDAARAIEVSEAATRVAGVRPRTHLRSFVHHARHVTSLGQLDDGAAWYARARAALGDDPDPLAHAWIAVGEATLAAWRHDRLRAAPLADEALRLALAAGSMAGACEAYNLLGNAALEADDLASAERHYRGALHYAALAGTTYLGLESNLAQVVVQSGRYAEALPLVDELEARGHLLGSPDAPPFAAVLRWACHAGLRDAAGWDALAPTLEALVDVRLEPVPFGRIGVITGDSWWAAGEPARARRAWGFALAMWRRAGRAEAVAQVEERLSR